MLININPQTLTGRWKAGFALDLHTLSSVPIEWTTKKMNTVVFIDGKPVIVEKEVKDKVSKWDTTYTPAGLEMHHLKYFRQRYRAEAIAAAAAAFLKQKMQNWSINQIVPIPPSDMTRQFQPVYEIANYLGKFCGLPVDLTLLKKLKSTTQLKQIEDPARRKEVLNGAFAIQNNSMSGKNILLFDDLYRSGETLNTVCDISINQGGAKAVYVLTITKTRSKRRETKNIPHLCFLVPRDLALKVYAIYIIA